MQPHAAPARTDADLTEDRQIHGNWIDFSQRYAHLILREQQLRGLIELDPTTRVNPDRDVLPTGQCLQNNVYPHIVLNTSPRCSLGEPVYRED